MEDGTLASDTFFENDLGAHTAPFDVDDKPAPYRLLAQDSSSIRLIDSAVVVSCPHAGRFYPEELVAAGSVGLEALRDLEDFAVDKLLAGMCQTNIGGIISNIARAYLDVNRPEDALDQTMFHEPVIAAKESQKVMAGYGLLPRLTGARALIYDALLPSNEVKRRIDLAYRPYHQQLQQMLEHAKQQYGRYLLVDCHSMPAADHHNRQLPDIVLGDCHGQTLSPDIGKRLGEYIRSEGFTLSWNVPYSGGFITGHYGGASRPGQSIQIEINRSLYMKDKHQLDKEGSARVTALLKSLLTFLDALVTGQIKTP